MHVVAGQARARVMARARARAGRKGVAARPRRPLPQAHPPLPYALTLSEAPKMMRSFLPLHRSCSCSTTSCASRPAAAAAVLAENLAMPAWRGRGRAGRYMPR